MAKREDSEAKATWEQQYAAVIGKEVPRGPVRDFIGEHVTSRASRETIWEQVGRETWEGLDRQIEVLNNYEDFRGGGPHRPRGLGSEPDDTRREALNNVLAVEALDWTFPKLSVGMAYMSVREFRAWVGPMVSGQLEVADWIRAVADLDREFLGEKGGLSVRGNWPFHDSLGGGTFGYYDAGGLSFVVYRAILLERFCGWSLEQAQLYIITGDTPEAPRAKHEISGSQILPMITLTIPTTYEPDEVAWVYERARSEAWSQFGIDRLRSARPHRVSQQAAERAVCAALYNDGRTWAEALAEWNGSHPADQFDKTKVRAFQKALTDAYRQVTWRSLEWQRRPGRSRKKEAD